MTQQNITPQQAFAWLEAGEAILIDVREPDEFKDGHITYAASIPLPVLGGCMGRMKMPAGKKIIFQCMKGGRGGKACALMQDSHSGADVFYNIEGGMEAWKSAGLPMVPSAGHPLPMPVFRQVQIVVGTLIFLLVAFGLSGVNGSFVLAGILGFMLAFAGWTGWCGLAILLHRMPWNRAG